MTTSKEKVTYTEEERETIIACAHSSIERDGKAAVMSAREAAIAAHRALLLRVRRSGGALPYKDLHFEFMREIDSPVPDAGLKASLRQQIIAASPEPAKPRLR